MYRYEIDMRLRHHALMVFKKFQEYQDGTQKYMTFWKMLIAFVR